MNVKPSLHAFSLVLSAIVLCNPTWAQINREPISRICGADLLLRTEQISWTHQSQLYVMKLMTRETYDEIQKNMDVKAWIPLEPPITYGMSYDNWRSSWSREREEEVRKASNDISFQSLMQYVDPELYDKYISCVRDFFAREENKNIRLIDAVIDKDESDIEKGNVHVHISWNRAGLPKLRRFKLDFDIESWRLTSPTTVPEELEGERDLFFTRIKTGADFILHIEGYAGQPEVQFYRALALYVRKDTKSDQQGQSIIAIRLKARQLSDAWTSVNDVTQKMLGERTMRFARRLNAVSYEMSGWQMPSEHLGDKIEGVNGIRENGLGVNNGANLKDVRKALELLGMPRWDPAKVKVVDPANLPNELEIKRL